MDNISNHYLYKTYRHILDRCLKEDHPAYKNYGGRGITICEEWAESPVAFLTYCDEVLGPRPVGFTLDRENNERGYEPGNVRWADRTTQNNNRRERAVPWREMRGITQDKPVGESGYKWVKRN